MILYFSRIGHYVNYIPWPVIAGFINGIALIIFLQQLPGFLGVAKGEGEGILAVSWHTLQSYLQAPTAPQPLLTVLTVLVMLIWGKQRALRAVPASMAALLIATLVSQIPGLDDLPRIGSIPLGLPVPALPVWPEGELTDLARAALAVAVLAALESLLSAVVADGMTIGERHNPNRELFGQGLANIGASLFGGIPATAALARTAVNIRSGARTRLAAMIHGGTLLLIVLFLGPLAGRIPLAALAGILMVVAVRMVEREAFRLIMRATKSDAFVLLLTMSVTVLFDLILAIELGLVAAGVLFIIRTTRMFSIDPTDLTSPATEEHPGDPEEACAEAALLRSRIAAYRIDGPIFFGAANRFFDQLFNTGGDIRVVILRMRRVPVMDATGLAALRALVERFSQRRILVLFSGLQPQLRQLLERTGILGEFGRGNHLAFPTTEEAIRHARAELRQANPPQPNHAPEERQHATQ